MPAIVLSLFLCLSVSLPAYTATKRNCKVATATVSGMPTALEVSCSADGDDDDDGVVYWLGTWHVCLA